MYLWKFSKCHSLVGVQYPRKRTKYQALPELIWWLPELIFQFLPYWFSFPMTYINKSLSAAAASHVSDSAVVFVTRAALLHSLPLIALIPHFNSYFVMYSVSTVAADNWNERNKCNHAHSHFTISHNWLNSPPRMEMKLRRSLRMLKFKFRWVRMKRNLICKEPEEHVRGRACEQNAS